MARVSEYTRDNIAPASSLVPRVAPWRAQLLLFEGQGHVGLVSSASLLSPFLQESR